MATAQYRGVLGTILTMVRTEGPRSLYSGLVAGLQRQMSFASVRIGLYDSVKQFYTPEGADSECGTKGQAGPDPRQSGGVGKPATAARQETDGPQGSRASFPRARAGRRQGSPDSGLSALSRLQHRHPDSGGMHHGGHGSNLCPAHGCGEDPVSGQYSPGTWERQEIWRDYGCLQNHLQGGRDQGPVER